MGGGGDLQIILHLRYKKILSTKDSVAAASSFSRVHSEPAYSLSLPTSPSVRFLAGRTGSHLPTYPPCHSGPRAVPGLQPVPVARPKLPGVSRGPSAPHSRRRALHTVIACLLQSRRQETPWETVIARSIFCLFFVFFLGGEAPPRSNSGVVKVTLLIQCW